jgi:hypothetical protein
MQGRAPVWDYLTSDDEQVGPGRPRPISPRAVNPEEYRARRA